MRINKINFYTNNINQNKHRQTNPINNNLVVFKGNEEDKVSFSEKVKSVFKKDKTKETPEYKKSEEIKYFLGDINCFNKELQKLGKYHTATLKTMLALGKLENYKGYVPLKAKNERLLFGEIDEFTELPTKVTHVKLDDGIKTIKSYNLVDGLNIFTVNDSTDKKDVSMTCGHKKVFYYAEREKETGLTKVIAINSLGFAYQESITDIEGNITSLEKIIDFKFDENERSTYEEKTESDEYDRYIYNKETDLWEKECTVLHIDE